MTARRAVDTSSPSYQGYQILHVAFTVAPLVGGVDKFLHVMGRLGHVSVPEMFGFTGPMFLMGVGVVELLAGVLVALKPRIGAWLVGFWLLGIACLQARIPAHFDLAARDFGLAISAFALARLSVEHATRSSPSSSSIGEQAIVGVGT